MELQSMLMAQVAVIHGRLGRHQIVDASGMPILDDPQFLVYERSTDTHVDEVRGQHSRLIGLGFIKASILVFYKSIFHVKSFRWAVYIILCIVIWWTTSYAFASLFTYWPATALIEPFYGNKCISAVPMWLSVVYRDILVDVGILIMRIPMVLKLQLPWPQKLGVLGMLLLGASICAIPVTRLIILTKIADEFILHYNDMTYMPLRKQFHIITHTYSKLDYTFPVFFWTNIELPVAVVSTCLPTLRPIWAYLKSSTETFQGSTGHLWRCFLRA
ncbi:hypothetical protein BU26DRAFT_566316 [Trematosphaeria pertusa]|uniref:Rhodopsin domain-containing protein n=1 Tax=Trematosphaeria pertusa TaxID=390896 RepID=A0A6A6IAC8_9PLEO|nr:uncharacterized protein BU26DRAFT_566316 [Trematosphaeria pertusa]KAF2247331.1 hypothetical protein BU26DRAFT_566316 [Trematosphaeria pertusa]